ncbi:hypothetical protein VULLAG_LOCUS7603 [Vulpes lagopus]
MYQRLAPELLLRSASQTTENGVGPRPPSVGYGGEWCCFSPVTDSEG